MKIALDKINALSELQRVGHKYDPIGQNEVRIICPVHDDIHPSCYLNTEKNTWVCHSCKAKGDIIGLLSHILKCERKSVIADLSDRYDLGVVKSIDLNIVEKYHEKIWTAGPLLTELQKRGITDQSIRKARLGYSEGRIMIPIFDQSGRVVNIRKYLPGAPGSEKMRNTKGMNSNALFQIEETKFETVWICGGEMKALAASQYLYEIGIGAIAATSGEGSWNKDFSQLLKNKSIFICMDIDRAGVEASKRLAAQIYHSVKSVKIIRLPLDISVHPKGDVNDWIHAAKPSSSDFVDLMNSAEKFFLEGDEEIEDVSEIKDIRLSEVCSAEFVGRTTRCEGIISALDENPYLIPKDIEAVCSKDQPNCMYCPVWPKDIDDEKGCVHICIKEHSAGVLDLVNSPTKNQKEGIREALKIPACKAVEFKVVSRYNVMDVRLIPPLQTSGDNSDHIVQPAYIMSKDVELNTPYTLTGKIFPNPRTQQSIFLVYKVEQGEDSLSNFNSDGDSLESLKIFQPKEWSVESIVEKFDDLYEDIESNITRIYKRRDLHIAIDLCFHSSMYFSFDGTMQNGWVNSLIIGDSSQGKSEATMRLIEFYGLGVRNDCKNATVAGLLGGLQQLGPRWFVSWGVIPIHDRRLVVLEEVKGTSYEVLGKLTDMRSSGIAEISKIEKRRAHARTRLLFISNPRSDRPISAYNFGIESIKELMGSLEDVRRFDMAIILSACQINAREINVLSTTRKHVEHIYSSDLCKKLVLRAWTRTSSDIRFEDGAINSCLVRATDLCDTFTEALPLCDRGTMRYKLARLAIALANRTFSVDENNYDVTVVRKCHVEYVYEFILSLYSSAVFGYKDFSKAQEFANKVSDPELVEKKLLASKHPRDLVQQLLHADEITLIDVQDWCDLDRDTAQKFLSFLVRKHAVYRVKNYYVKTSEFINVLKGIRDSGKLDKVFSIDEREDF